MNSKNVQVIFTCFLCGQKMRNKSGYRKHMKFCVFINDDGMRLFPCFLCGEELENKTEYRKHLEMCFFNSDSPTTNLCKEQESDTLPLNCACCEKTFNNENEYYAHVEMGVRRLDHCIEISELKCEEDEEATEEVPQVASHLTAANKLNMSESGASVNLRHVTSNARVNVKYMETCKTATDAKNANGSSFYFVQIPTADILDDTIAKGFTCDFCGQIFDRRKRLINHLITKHQFLQGTAKFDIRKLVEAMNVLERKY